MFQALLPLLRTAKLNAQISTTEDNEILVLLLPQKKEGQSPLIASPMRFKGTAAYLDQHIAEQITALTQARQALVVTVESQIEESKKQAQELVEKAKKESVEKQGTTTQGAAKPAAASQGSKTPATAKPSAETAAPKEKAKPEVKNPWG